MALGDDSRAGTLARMATIMGGVTLTLALPAETRRPEADQPVPHQLDRQPRQRTARGPGQRCDVAGAGLYRVGVEPEVEADLRHDQIHRRDDAAVGAAGQDGGAAEGLLGVGGPSRRSGW